MRPSSCKLSHREGAAVYSDSWRTAGFVRAPIRALPCSCLIVHRAAINYSPPPPPPPPPPATARATRDLARSVGRRQRRARAGGPSRRVAECPWAPLPLTVGPWGVRPCARRAGFVMNTSIGPRVAKRKQASLAGSSLVAGPRSRRSQLSLAMGPPGATRRQAGIRLG